MKYFLLFSVVCSVLFAPSCTKDKAAEPPPPYNCDSVNYSLNIKPILDTHCSQPKGSCHDLTGAKSAIIMENYTDAKYGFESRNALCTINQTSGCIPMPEDQPKLADSLINIIQCWVNNGYPE